MSSSFKSCGNFASTVAAHSNVRALAAAALCYAIPVKIAESPPKLMIRFRPISSSDLGLLLEWLQRPHVKEWWDDGDDTIDKVAAHYLSEPEITKRFILEIDGKGAGYFQYHCYSPRHIGVDQFLANETQLSMGVGTQCLLEFLHMILATEAPSIVSVDPHPANRRAIRCYEKCGFVTVPSQSNALVCLMIKNYGPTID